MFRSNWTEISWNVLIRPEAWLFGVNKRNNCQCSSRTPKTSGDPRIWRFIGGLAFLSAVRPPAGSFGQKMPACSKNRPWHPPILGRGKSAGFSPLTFRLLECSGRRLDGKGWILERNLWNLAAEGTFSEARFPPKEKLHLRWVVDKSPETACCLTAHLHIVKVFFLVIIGAKLLVVIKTLWCKTY